MNIFVVQLIAIIIALVASFLLMLEVLGISTAHISDPDDFWNGRSPGPRRQIYFKTPITMKILILMGLIAAGMIALELTHFDICSFLWFWDPEVQSTLPPRCP